MFAGGRKGAGGARRRRAGRLGLIVVAVASVWALIAAVAAQATTVTVGSVLPVTFKATPFEGVRTQFNTALPETGANLASPVNGAIVRWRVQGAKGGPFRLRVLHPNGAGAYTAAGTSLPATPLGPGIETFATQIPVRSGDLIGIDPTSASDEIGVATVSGASYGLFSTPPLEGSTVPPSEVKSGAEIELSAEIQPAPAVTKVAPESGSVLGGEKVKITGTNLNAASAVMFGEVPASAFTVVSEEEITATAPAQSKPGSYDVVVKTLAGESPAARADQFSYAGCVVPKLSGKSLKQAKQRLRGANCAVGTVSKKKAPKRKRGQVLKQSPKAGTVLAPGAKVAIKLGR
jgi:hypothetical protein